MRLPPADIQVTEDIDSRTIRVSSVPAAPRPLLGCTAIIAGLLVVAFSFWALGESQSIFSPLSMLAGFLGAGACVKVALSAFMPRDTVTHTLRLTATHLQLNDKPPVLLEELTTIAAEPGQLRLQWGRAGTTLGPLAPDSVAWLADTIAQAASRRAAAPHQPVPDALRGLRER